jgi:hypothetical protein
VELEPPYVGCYGWRLSQTFQCLEVFSLFNLAFSLWPLAFFLRLCSQTVHAVPLNAQFAMDLDSRYFRPR